MSEIIARAYFSYNSDGATRKTYIKSAAEGVSFGWPTRQELATHVLGAASDGSGVFEHSDGEIEGSGKWHTTANIEGMASAPNVDNVMEQLSILANDMDSGIVDGDIETEWENRQDYPLFSTTEGEGLFTLVLGPRPATEVRQPAGSVGGNGVRTGGISLGDHVGTVAVVKEYIASDEGRAAMMECLSTNPTACFKAKSGLNPKKWITLSAEETIDKLASESCVYLCSWLRLDRTALSTLLLTHLREPVRTPGSLMASTSHIVSRMGSKLMWNIMSVCAMTHGITPAVYWKYHMSDKVDEFQLRDLATEFKIDIHIIRLQDYVDYNNEILKEGKKENAAMVSSAYRPGSEQDNKRVRFAMRFIGSKQTTDPPHERLTTDCGSKRIDNREGYRMVIIWHNELQLESHAEVLLDPRKELVMLGQAYNVTSYDVTYGPDQSDDDNDTGFYDRQLVYTEIEEDVRPQIVYGGMKGFDLEETIMLVHKKDIVFIATMEEFYRKLDTVVKETQHLFDPDVGHSEINYGNLNETWYLSRTLVTDLADENGHVELNTVGLVYLMGLAKNKLDEGKVGNMVSFNKFTTTNGRVKATVLHNRKEDGRALPDCMTNFDDVSAFRASLFTQKDANNIKGPQSKKRKNPSDADDEQTPHNGRSNNEPSDQDEEMNKVACVTYLFEIKYYSEPELDTAMVYVDTPEMVDKIQEIADNMYKKEFKIKGGESKDIRVRDRARDSAVWVKDRVLSRNTATRIAMTISKSVSVFMCLAERLPMNKNFIENMNKTWGVVPSSGDEKTRSLAPHIDEPVVAIGTNRECWDDKSACIEVDISLAHTQAWAGRFDGVWKLDLYGEKFVHTSPTRAMVRKLRSGEVLTSYKADFGDVYVSDINMPVLYEKLGISKINSWSKFSIDNIDRVERRVMCASVITFTRELVVQLQDRHEAYDGTYELPWLYEHRNDEVGLWRAVQLSVFSFEYAFFHHDPDARSAILLVYERIAADKHNYMPGFNGVRTSRHPYDEYGILKGHLDGPGEDRTMIHNHKCIDNTYTYFYSMCRRTMDEQSARTAVKIDMNRTIGMMKHGQYGGGLKKWTLTDALDTEEGDTEGDMRVLRIAGVPFKRGYKTQFCVRELPNTDYMLIERVMVAPVVTSGFPRELRRYIMETIRHVIDELGYVAQPRQVKTDAAFFNVEDLDSILEFIHKTYPGTTMVVDNGVRRPVCVGDIMCTDPDCTIPSCVNSAVDIHVGHGVIATDYSTLGTIAHFKIDCHPGINNGNVRGDADYLMEENHRQDQINASCDASLHSTSSLKLSQRAKRAIADSLVVQDEPEEYLYSSAVPSVEEMMTIPHMLTCQPGQTIGDDPTPHMNKLQLHCHIRVPGQATIRVGEPGSAQPMIINKDALNELVTTRILDKMESYPGGFKMDGKPGMGKSYATMAFIKRMYLKNPDAIFFIMTGTHLSVAPYLPLIQWEDEQLKLSQGGPRRIHIGTIHSMVGVFSEIKQAASDPYKWFTSARTYSKSRVNRELIEFRKTRPRKGEEQVWLIGDEYEMISRPFEEVILYMSKMPRTYTILLGDPAQTAAYGAGFRCDGDVVSAVTRNKTIIFDLPFRNPDYEYQMAQHEAINGRPTLFLKEPLSNFVVVNNRHSQVYKDLIIKAADKWVKSATDNVIYSGSVIAVQNHKASVTVSLDVLDAMSRSTGYVPSKNTGYTYIGSNAYKKKGKDTTDETDQVGNEDDEGDLNDDDDDEAAGAIAEASKSYVFYNYHGKYNPNAVNPKGYRNKGSEDFSDPKGNCFYVGTKMDYRIGFTYRAMTRFRPKTRYADPVGIKDKKFGEAYKQAIIPMGTVMILVSFGTETYRRRVWNKKQKVYKYNSDRIMIGMFRSETNGKSAYHKLRTNEMRAHVYYPFCLTTSGVVGHTFDDYTMVKMSTRSSIKYDYANLSKQVEWIEDVLGPMSYVSPLIKTLNVGVSRVTYGNRSTIVEIMGAGKGFWRSSLLASKWHTRTHYEEKEYKNNILYRMRADVKESSEIIDVAAIRTKKEEEEEEEEDQ